MAAVDELRALIANAKRMVALTGTARTGNKGGHENCYLRELGSCSDQLSREQLVSEAVLHVIWQ